MKKSVKEYDERELKYYYKVRSQTLTIVVVEMFIAVYVYVWCEPDKITLLVMAVILIFIPITFRDIRMVKIDCLNKNDIIVEAVPILLITVMFSMSLFWGMGDIYKTFLLLLLIPWGSYIIHAVLALKNIKDNEKLE